MKGIYVLMAVLLVAPSIFGGFGISSPSEIPERKDLIEDMPTLENISSFIGAIPSLVGNIDFGVRNNITMELVAKTGNIDILYEKNQPWLEDAILEFYSINGMNVSNQEIQKFFNEIDSLPNELKEGIALLLYSINDATLSCHEATKSLSGEEINFLKNNNETESDMLSLLKSVITERMHIFPNLNLFSSNSDKLSMLTQDIDMEKMVEGSLSILESTRCVLPAIEKYGSMYPNGTILKDPSGAIVVGGGGTDAYAGDYSLIVDLGGSDVYNVKNIDEHVSVVLDASGNDYYRGDAANSFLGINMLIDISGNDFYTSGDWSQSYACAGISLMLDLNGDDVYSGGDYSQGSASAGGIAILSDVSGDDVYHAGKHSQGFANGNSFSLLADIFGSDIYYSEDYSQGSASAGGISLLLDFLGNDRYISQKNSQGAGEGWANGMKKLSTGILADFSGNDTYRAGDSSQAFGQTSGVGLIADFLGDDDYIAKSSSQACSKLFGIALLMDMYGNNTYKNENENPSNGYESTGGMSLLLDGISSAFNEKLWELLLYISQNDINPISSFFGAVGK